MKNQKPSAGFEPLLLRWSSITMFCLSVWLMAPAAAKAAAADFQTYQAADAVLGEPNFTSALLAQGQAGRFAGTGGVAMDPTTGKVFVSDFLNSRVLRFSSAAAAAVGANPEAVFGQPNFASCSANQGAGVAAANTLYSPFLLFVDATGRLWVADEGNNRILGFQVASFLSNDPPADIVLGQPGFTTRAASATSSTMSQPSMAMVGANDTLWVTDSGNGRVLRFDAISSKTNGAAADGVLGHADFTTGTSGVGAAGLTSPVGLWADAMGSLWVADYGNNRVLRFDHAAAKTNGANADALFGQPSIAVVSSGTSASKLSSPASVYLDPHGDLWIAEFGNQRVVRYPDAVDQNFGVAADLVLGEPDLDTAAGGLSARDLKTTYQVSPGPDGSLFVAEAANSRVLRFSPIVPPAVAAPLAPVPTPMVAVSGKHQIATSKSAYTLKGSASDANGALFRVEVKVGKAAFKPAGGTTRWKSIVKLKVGKTAVQIRALDASGVFSPPVKITITRR